MRDGGRNGHDERDVGSGNYSVPDGLGRSVPDFRSHVVFNIGVTLLFLYALTFSSSFVIVAVECDYRTTRDQ